jgi:transcriptional regulator with XRE-family HTH domain
MNEVILGRALERNRRKAGLSQAAVAARMGTKQPAISRAESGRVMPTIDFIERFARATGRRFELDLPQRRRRVDRARRVREVLGGYVFNPWDRDPTRAEQRSLLADGLTRESFEPSSPPVEFPEAMIEGDESRTVEVEVAGEASVRIIGVDDLYLDRVRQATVNEPVEGIEFHSALAVAAGAFEEIDWRYVSAQISATRRRGELLGGSMSRIDRRIRRRVRRALP